MKNLNLLFTIIVFCFIAVQLIAQTPQFAWANQMCGERTNIGQSFAREDIGNIYKIGNFERKADVDQNEGIFNLTFIAGTDIFVHKLSNATFAITNDILLENIQVYPNPACGSFLPLNLKQSRKTYLFEILNEKGNKKSSK